MSSSAGKKSKKPFQKNRRKQNSHRDTSREQSNVPLRAKETAELAPDPSGSIPVVFVKNRISQPLLYRKPEVFHYHIPHIRSCQDHYNL